MLNVEFLCITVFETLNVKKKKKKERIRFSLDWANDNGDNNINNNVTVI